MLHDQAKWFLGTTSVSVRLFGVRFNRLAPHPLTRWTSERMPRRLLGHKRTDHKRKSPPHTQAEDAPQRLRTLIFLERDGPEEHDTLIFLE